MTAVKDLKKLIKLLRSEGVTDFKDGALELKLGPVPHVEPRHNSTKTPAVPQELQDAAPEYDFPTPEQMLFAAVDGFPEKKQGDN